jgi:hypothetical protein
MSLILLETQSLDISSAYVTSAKFVSEMLLELQQVADYTAVTDDEHGVYL